MNNFWHKAEGWYLKVGSNVRKRGYFYRTDPVGGGSDCGGSSSCIDSDLLAVFKKVDTALDRQRTRQLVSNRARQGKRKIWSR